MLFRAPVLCLAASLISVPLAAALPTTERRSDMTLTSRDDTQCEAGKTFYTCYINSFRGCCSVDPCALKDGCPDYKAPTYPNPNPNPNPGTDSKEPPSTYPTPKKDDTQCDAGKNFYVCALNNFRGCCSVDPCALKDGCPDYKDPTGSDSKTDPKPKPKGMETPGSKPITNTDNGQCEAGKNYYVCALNNFRGCCSVDPCALKDSCPDKSLTDEEKPDNTDDKTPNTDPSDKEDTKDNEPSQESPSSKAPSCPSGNKKTVLFQPKTETLIPNKSPITTPNINVTKSASKEWQQRISWTLPASAKDCRIGWSIPEKRNFKAGSKAELAVYDAADNSADAKSLGKANFAFWPETDGPRTSPVATVECKEEMAFRVEMLHDDSVFLEQNGETGWWVEYSC